MAPDSDTASRDRYRRQIRQLLAGQQPARRRLRPLDLLLFGLIAGHLLVANLQRVPAPVGQCFPAAAVPTWPG